MSRANPSLHTYVALLRGINVGGNNMVSMGELKKSLEGLGFWQVQTYINSGNVIFQSEVSDPRTLEATLEKNLAPHFPQPIRVLVRSLKEMKTTVERIPASWQQPGQKCNVIFIGPALDRPDIISQFTLKPDIEEVHYAPGVLFWSAKLDSVGRSAMLKLNSTPFYQHMTVRGENTTRKIYELMQQYK